MLDHNIASWSNVTKRSAEMIRVWSYFEPKFKSKIASDLYEKNLSPEIFPLPNYLMLLTFNQMTVNW